MTNAELITELTYHASIEKRKLLSDAADALEAAEKRIAELEEEHNKTVTAIFGEEQLWWENRCKELEAARMELTAKCRRLEAQLPKEGEWIGVNPMVDTEQCSICGWNIPTDEFESNYCPNCGAKMKGANDEES